MPVKFHDLRGDVHHEPAEFGETRHLSMAAADIPIIEEKLKTEQAIFSQLCRNV